MFNKQLTSYLDDRQRIQQRDEPPGAAFLREVVHICDAVHHCQRTFTRKKDRTLTKDSQDSFDRIVTSCLAMMMSHFETFQRQQFATLLDSSFCLQMPGETELAKSLQKAGCELSLERLLVGGSAEGEVGEIIADLLPGWHNAARVNSYFKTIFPDINLFSNDIIAELDLLWQLRHSVVHTGGVISRADARKVTGLRSFANRPVTFAEDFVPALGRRFHIVIEDSLRRLRTKVESSYTQLEDESQEERDAMIFELVGFASPRSSWFREVSATSTS